MNQISFLTNCGENKIIEGQLLNDWGGYENNLSGMKEKTLREWVFNLKSGSLFLPLSNFIISWIYKMWQI